MGREFIDIFEDWAEDYDHAVSGHDPQYKAVFADYENILHEVAKASYGNVLEFGVGTGNLTDKLLQAGLQVTGIEPSPAMREIVREKLPEIEVVDGDFITFPNPTIEIDTIVSSYAFHHLNDVEKEQAVRQFAEMLPVGGKIVFADTMFESNVVKENIIHDSMQKGYTDLVDDLNREYYPIIDDIRNIFERSHFDISFKQMNDFVWLIIANKK
ncbi:methyltransferase domain-containing protein [Ornithinibacillus sp. L9]|uniref:Uncharacterized methyltransferase GMD78_10305 n=1 Tax=Ornithinibacillus caprae TaxID=2678566 RepID=A0A6N8FKD7_9BACI|nr:class I SAM-dependent methyltransferase [Ornithinibacillus caprae]MUK88784.1 methyltransferase domain-containing protein [Ornithinibacillus caprae]